MSIVHLIKEYTIGQWIAIDAEYRDPEAKSDLKGIGSLVSVSLLLIIRRYYGRPRTFSIIFGKIAKTWPYPDMWPYLYGTFTAFLLYFIVPSLFIYFVFHERIRDHGFSVKGFTRYIWLYIAMLAVVIPLAIIASRSPEFIRKYPLYSGAGNSLPQFLIYESAYGVYFLSLEFFLRGFMLFALARYMGAYAIFVMVIPYSMIHFGKPVAETIGSIIAGTALGTLALRSRSIFGGLLIHVTVAWTMDILAVVSSSPK